MWIVVRTWRGSIFEKVGVENAADQFLMAVRIRMRLPDVDTLTYGFQSQISFFLGLEGTTRELGSERPVPAM